MAANIEKEEEEKEEEEEEEQEKRSTYTGGGKYPFLPPTLPSKGTEKKLRKVC